MTKLTVSLGQHYPAESKEVRLAVEVPLARSGALRRTGEDLAIMGSILGRHGRSALAEDAVASEAKFHSAIAGATGNQFFQFFVRLVEDLRQVLQEQSLAVSSLRTRGQRDTRDDKKICGEIVDGNGACATAAKNAHLDTVERAIHRLGVGANQARGSLPRRRRVRIRDHAEPDDRLLR